MAITTQGVTMSGSMRGLRVLDFSMGIAGPHAGMLCAQHGAEVIKIEPLYGDWARELGRQYGDLTAFALMYNRGKKSLAIDLKDPVARKTIKAIALTSDVLLESFRPSVMDTFGLGYEALYKERPDIIYVSVTGFGGVGPLVRAPATDVILQAFSGLMNCNKNDEGVPQRLDMFVIDAVTGLYAFQCITTSLMEKLRFGGDGKHIDCSLMKSAMALQAGKIIENFIEKSEKPTYAPLGVLPTSDGFLAISVRRDDHFVTLCRLLARPDLIESGKYTTAEMRVDNVKELLPELNKEFRSRTTEQLISALTQADILHSRVNRYQDLLAHEQVLVSRAIDWQKQDGLSMDLPIPAIPGVPDLADAKHSPHLGEHSLEILANCGIEKGVIEELLSRGAIKQFSEAR